MKCHLKCFHQPYLFNFDLLKSINCKTHGYWHVECVTGPEPGEDWTFLSCQLQSQSCTLLTSCGSKRECNLDTLERDFVWFYLYIQTVYIVLTYSIMSLCFCVSLQDDKDLVHEFVMAEGLTCLIKVGAEADQNYQNYILRGIVSLHNPIQYCKYEYWY